MYYHFIYTSGGNPYIAKTEEEKARIINKHEEAGEKVTQLSEFCFMIDDIKVFDSWPISHIKVNLPQSEQDYKDGAGEGVFVIVSAKTKEAHDNDISGSGYKGVLDNDSCYYSGLYHGAIIPLEMRGENWPVVPYTWLKERYTLNE